MRRAASAIAVLFLVAGCAATSGPTPSTATPSSTASASETAVATASAPTRTSVPATTTPSPTLAACPSLDEPMSVATYFAALEAKPLDGSSPCFDGEDVTLLGWADAMPGVGFMPPGIAPGWLWIPTGALWEFDCDEDCGSLWVHIDPASEIEWHDDGRWVLVTGHTGDPLAETCHWVYPEGWTEGENPVSEAQDHCRESFVVTAVEQAPSGP